jgi:hypothetical protein
MFKKVIYVAFLTLLIANSVIAQENSTPTRFRGEISSITNSEISIIDKQRVELKFNISPDQAVQEVYPISKEMIQANSYIGSAGMVGADGSLKALEVLVFPELSRGTGEGHYSWDLQEGSTMTNATVDQLKWGKNDFEMSVRYKDGTKKIVVDDNTPIVSIKPGDRRLLIPGAYVVITALKKGGQWTVLRISAGRDGFKPPM